MLFKSMIDFEKIKNTHWLAGVIVSVALFLWRLFSRKLSKSEKELLKKIKNQPHKKLVFIKFDNTEPFSKDIDIQSNNSDLVSLVKKGYLQKYETSKSISFVVVRVHQP